MKSARRNIRYHSQASQHPAGLANRRPADLVSIIAYFRVLVQILLALPTKTGTLYPMIDVPKIVCLWPQNHHKKEITYYA